MTSRITLFVFLFLGLGGHVFSQDALEKTVVTDSADTVATSKAKKNRDVGLGTEYGLLYSDATGLNLANQTASGWRVNIQVGNGSVGKKALKLRYQIAMSWLQFNSPNSFSNGQSSEVFLNPFFGLELKHSGLWEGLASLSLGISGGALFGDGQWAEFLTNDFAASSLAPSISLSLRPAVTMRMAGDNYIRIGYDFLYLGALPKDLRGLMNGLLLAPVLAYNFR